MKESRIYDNSVDLDKIAIRDFFNKRAPKSIDENMNNSTMLQDKKPEIATKRDLIEKQTIEPYFITDEQSKILDIGCGIGRWAEIFKEKDMTLYQGIDISEKLIAVAAKVYNDNEKIQFYSKDPIEFFATNNSKFDIVILSSVLNYINDTELQKIFTEIEKFTNKNALIYFRMPISVLDKRLTLKEFWSDELEESYSSVYRTDKEYKESFEKYLKDYNIVLDKFLYKEETLNNRIETKQKVYILKKKEN